VNTPAIATVYPTRDQQRRGDACSWPERRLDVGDEASRRRLDLRELGDGEGEEADGDRAGENRQWGGDAGCSPLSLTVPRSLVAVQ
jgi:hypothetical protein